MEFGFVFLIWVAIFALLFLSLSFSIILEKKKKIQFVEYKTFVHTLMNSKPIVLSELIEKCLDWCTFNSTIISDSLIMQYILFYVI